MEQKNNRNRIVIIILVLLLLLGGYYAYYRIGNMKADLNIMEQNNKALNDSVRVSKNKVGDLEYSKNVLVSKNGDLSKLNSELASELKKEYGKVSELTKFVAVLKNNPKDTVFLPTDLVTYPNGDRGLKWTADTIYDAQNYRKLSGESRFKINFTSATYEIVPLSTIITNDEIKFNIIQGLREKDGNLEMFVRSDYPGFSVQELNSVIIDPQTHPVLSKFTAKEQRKRWAIGFYAGYGPYFDNFNGRAGFGAHVGLGINYILLSF